MTTTELLPAHHPLFTAATRALPVGLLITLLLRRIPRGSWWWRAGTVGLLNIGFCFALLFIGVYRLPGGVAATIGAIAPLEVAIMGWPLLGLRPGRLLIIAGVMGMTGVGLLVLGSAVHLDAVGIAAAAGGATSMSLGTVLTKRWGRPPGVSVLSFTGWQLVAGGVFLAPLALILEGAPRTYSAQNVVGYLYLCLIGTGIAYTVWFRGVSRLPATSVTFLNLLIPIVAAIAGYLAYHQSFSPEQIVGMAIIGLAIFIAQRPARDVSAGAHVTPNVRYKGSIGQLYRRSVGQLGRN